MSRDSSRTYLHLHVSSHADLFEDFTRSGPLQPDEIFLPAQHQPLNPEDEDDVVPDMHAAFGIQRATLTNGKGGTQEKAWRDLGLEGLLRGAGGTEGEGRGTAVTGPTSAVNGTAGERVRRDGDGVVGRTLGARRRVEGTAGARLRS